MNARQISISTLSPLHVGCDEVYEPSNFVITDSLLHSLDPAILADELSEAERKQLTKLTEDREPIGALQRFFRDHAPRFATLASHQVSVAKDIVDEYDKSAGKPTQRGPVGEATYNLFPIARTSYRPFDNIPYLPGSSLKGSIRTAWLNHLNRGAALTADERTDKKGAHRRLQERLLGYRAGKFEDDPFRHIAVADAHPEPGATPPPTNVLYAISKKKRAQREGERGSPELKVFLETIPDALPSAFLGELRIDASGQGKNIDWNALCDACNGFYKPQLEAELSHTVLGNLLDTKWKQLIGDLLADELGKLIDAHQGFLLRVGRHSGAESVTLDGVRDIKILGKTGEPPTYRQNTTQKRFASQTKAGAAGLIPFGWIWVDACDDKHRHLSDAVCQKLAERSAAVREAHEKRLLHLDDTRQQRGAAAAEAAKLRKAANAAAAAAAASAALRQSALAALSPNARRVEEFVSAFTARSEQLRGSREKLWGEFHARARDLARDARENPDWTAEEKRAAASAIAEWLPKVVERIDKDQLKKLNLSALLV
jgi:CRISPR-associated protein Csm5